MTGSDADIELVEGRAIVRGIDAAGRPEVIDGGAVAHRGGSILAIGERDAIRKRYPGARLAGGPQFAVLPGFVNAHHHVGLTPFQLGVGDMPLEVWLAARLGARSVDLYLDTLYSAFELIASGVTTVQHLHGRLGGGLDALLTGAGSVIRAYDEIGMRVSYSFGARDQNRLAYEDDAQFIERLPADIQPAAREAAAAQTVDLDDAIAMFETLHRRHPGDGRIAIQLAPVNLHWCSDAALERIGDVSRRYDVPMHMHLVETRYQKEYARRRTGTTALRHLERLGLLGPRLTLGHGVWLDGEDIDIVADTGTCLCHNASSNLRLASGVAPLTRFLERKLTIGIGLDEAGLNDDRDMLQEMRLVLKLHRPPGIETRRPTSAEVFAMATAGGAATTPFRDRIGRLDPGMGADMVLIDWNALAYPYLEADVPVIDAILHRARSGHVREVRIAGETVYRDGRFTRIDRDAVLGEIAARLTAPLTPGEEARRALARRLDQPVRDFYRGYYDASGDRPFYRSSALTSD